MFSLLCTILKVRWNLSREASRLDALDKKAAQLKRALEVSQFQVFTLQGKLCALENELSTCAFKWAQIAKRNKEDGAKGE